MSCKGIYIIELIPKAVLFLTSRSYAIGS